MKGVIYLNYYAKMGLSGDTVRCRISRTVPERCRVDYNLEGLYPPAILLKYFKEGRIDWNTFRERYADHLMNSDQAQKDIGFLLEKIENGESVTLLCWERYMPCHRFILGQLFFDAGVEVKSFDCNVLEDYTDAECYYERGVLDSEFIKASKLKSTGDDV